MGWGFQGGGGMESRTQWRVSLGPEETLCSAPLLGWDYTGKWWSCANDQTCVYQLFLVWSPFFSFKILPGLLDVAILLISIDWEHTYWQEAPWVQKSFYMNFLFVNHNLIHFPLKKHTYMWSRFFPLENACCNKTTNLDTLCPRLLSLWAGTLDLV